jgi:predicted N-acetyltransferase YhbS
MPPEALVRTAAPADLLLMKELHDRTFGPGCFARTAYRIREGTPPLTRFCLVSYLGGELVATLRLTPITVGGVPGALLLGPLAVEATHAGKGYGKALVARAIVEAREAGITFVLLVGNESYYARFGFVRVERDRIRLPGPVDPDRLLAVETTSGALAAARGLVAADLGTG